jgi:hypothetical protein
MQTCGTLEASCSPTAKLSALSHSQLCARLSLVATALLDLAPSYPRMSSPCLQHPRASFTPFITLARALFAIGWRVYLVGPRAVRTCWCVSLAALLPAGRPALLVSRRCASLSQSLREDVRIGCLQSLITMHFRLWRCAGDYAGAHDLAGN